METQDDTNVPRRALLTDREREIIAGDADDITDKYRYEVISRIRRSYKRLETDLRILDEHHDTLGQELRDVVCED